MAQEPFDPFGPRPSRQAPPQPQQLPNPLSPPPAAPAPGATTAPGAGRRRFGASLLIALALTGGAIGGGAAGSAVTAGWLAAASPNGPAITAQPIAAPGGAATVAGAVFSQVNPAVVRVIVAGGTGNGLTPTGSGSGVVVDASGLILTNNHVVEGARAVSVRFSTGASREARVLGSDRGADLAVLQVDLPANTPVAALGDSDAVQVGETAIAIGSPFGLDQTVTQGIISAVDREWQPGDGRLRRDLIQTDAPINPGNSGGPLLNAAGEVIGINTMIESPVRGSVGVGFAVPINTAKRLLPQLQSGARLEPVWLGITGQELDTTIARDQGLAIQEGILVTGAIAGGPAALAGVRGGQDAGQRIPRGGDVLRAIDGAPVRTLADLADRLTGRRPGDTVTLTIWRDGQDRQLPVTLAAWPAGQP